MTIMIIGSDPHVKPDRIDGIILRERVGAWSQKGLPRVGDFIEFSDGIVEQFSYDWGDSIQSSEGGSFYLGKGYVSFSGALNTAIPKDKVSDSGRTKLGKFWFFHHDDMTAHNGVYVNVACRIFTTELNSKERANG